MKMKVSLFVSLVLVLIVHFVESKATSRREENSSYGKYTLSYCIDKLLVAVSFIKHYKVKAYRF